MADAASLAGRHNTPTHLERFASIRGPAGDRYGIVRGAIYQPAGRRVFTMEPLFDPPITRTASEVKSGMIRY